MTEDTYEVNVIVMVPINNESVSVLWFVRPFCGFPIELITLKAHLR